MRVAAAQYPIDKLETLDLWREKVSRWVEDGASMGAQLLVFPEYSAIEQAGALGASVFCNLQTTLREVAAMEDERVSFHTKLAKDFSVHILVGSGPGLCEDGKIYNNAHLVSASGAVGVQSKMVMTPFERDWGVCAGSGLKVFDTDLGRIGVAICYDVEFPLIARAMACHGAELLLVPSCTERVTGYHRVRAGAMARALENTLASVQSPTVGEASWSPVVDINCGASGIYLPAEFGICETGVLAQGTVDEPGWVVGEIDITALRRTREKGEMRNVADWSAQPGGTHESPSSVEVVCLRG